jgi:hypothetical protein
MRICLIEQRVLHFVYNQTQLLFAFEFFQAGKLHPQMYQGQVVNHICTHSILVAFVYPECNVKGLGKC